MWDFELPFAAVGRSVVTKTRNARNGVYKHEMRRVQD